MDNKNVKTPEMFSNNVASKEQEANNKFDENVVASKEQEANNKFDEFVVATQPLIQEPGWSNADNPPPYTNNIQEQPIWNKRNAPPPCYQETTQTFVQEDRSSSCSESCYICTQFLELFVVCCECIVMCAQAFGDK